MEYKNFNGKIYLRLDKNDEVISCLTEVCKKEHISAASVSGIGGCGEIEVGTFILDKQDYKVQHKTGMFEMLSLTGNITLKEDIPFPHVHAVFSYLDENEESKLIGGHLKKAVIILTGEIVITPAENNVIKRVKNDDLGIFIWEF